MYKILKAQNGDPIPNTVPPLGSVKLPNISAILPKTSELTSPDVGLSHAAKIGKTKASSQYGSGGSNGMSAGLQQGLNFAGSMLGQLSGGNLTPEQNATREGIRSGIGSFGPIGAIISAASGVVDAIGSATGLNLDNLDRGAAKRAGISGAAGANNFLNSLPGVSMLVGMFSGKTAKSNKSVEINKLTSAYGGSVGNIDAAQKLSNKRTLFGKGKANKFIRNQNRINDILTDISLDAKLAKSNTAAETYLSQNQNTYSGYSPQLLLSKNGMKLPELDEARKLINFWSLKSTKKQELQKFQNGGKLESKNVIPVGELHKNLHHLDDKYPELEGQITKKGIPVITSSENGIEQCAEIERHELILCKPVTEQVEQYYKDYNNTKDESLLIECGKFVTEQIIKNTIDKDKVIKNTDDKNEPIKK